MNYHCDSKRGISAILMPNDLNYKSNIEHCLYASEVTIDIGFVQRQITQRTKLGKPSRRLVSASTASFESRFLTPNFRHMNKQLLNCMDFAPTIFT
ncbi:hypothetical protein Avbf_11354 [Armadillidium vulgare]|nr:hypothetical protein Avbf_11354 [Armadillidium vulgare]